MGMDVTGPQPFHQKFLIGSLRQIRLEIRHYRLPAQISGFHCPVHRFPGGMFPVKGPSYPVMGRLYAHHNIPEGFCHCRRNLWMKLPDILLRVQTDHPASGNIDKCKNPQSAFVNDLFLEPDKVPAPTGSCIHRRGDAALEHMGLGVDRWKAVFLKRKGRVYVAVHVNKPRRHIASFCGNNYGFTASGQVFSNLCYFSFQNTDIPFLFYISGRIKNGPPL
ncbi:hypothetical protein IMSAG249_01433 [Lachnospiraceae bacterium]|nr:hypothetical protein IMSAG249_01433 [Lachnospiraceae bacterium]